MDRTPGPTLATCVAVVAAALLTGITVLAWGAAFTAVPVSLQSAVLRVAPHAQDAASAVYIVAFQIGIGGGALVGERTVVVGGLHHLPAVGAVLAVATAVITPCARRVFPPNTKPSDVLAP